MDDLVWIAAGYGLTVIAIVSYAIALTHRIRQAERTTWTAVTTRPTDTREPEDDDR